MPQSRRERELYGEHSHICPVCHDTWSHDFPDCEEVTRLECPIHDSNTSDGYETVGYMLLGVPLD